MSPTHLQNTGTPARVQRLRDLRSRPCGLLTERTDASVDAADPLAGVLCHPGDPAALIVWADGRTLFLVRDIEMARARSGVVLQ